MRSCASSVATPCCRLARFPSMTPTVRRPMPSRPVDRISIATSSSIMENPPRGSALEPVREDRVTPCRLTVSARGRQC